MIAETKQVFHCPENLDYALRLDCPNWRCPQVAECFRDKWPDINARYFALKGQPNRYPENYKGVPVAEREPRGNCKSYHSADCPFDRKFRDAMTPTDATCIDFEPVARGRFTR